jgi:NitT/TauT family transport system substrate-binding protein
MIFMKANKFQFTAGFFAVVFLLAVSGGSLWAGGGRESAAQSDSSGEKPLKIRIGTDSGVFSYPFRVADRQGFFKKYNIDADISTYAYGIDTINAAILGETESAQGMDYAVASRFSESNRLRIVAYVGGYGYDSSELVVHDNNIKTPADLRGKRLGVSKGTVNEYIWALLLDKFGLTAKNVEQLYFSSNAELITAYQAGHVDSIWAGSTIWSAVNEVPNNRSLGDYSLIDFKMRGYLMFDADFIAKNPAAIDQVLRALDEATEYIKANHQQTARLIYEELRIPEAGALDDIEKFQFDLRLYDEDLNHLTNVANWSIDNGLIRNRYNIRNFVDVEPLRRIFPERLRVTN